MEDPIRKLTPWAAFVGGLGLLVWAFFDQLKILLDLDATRLVLRWAWELTVILLAALASIVVSWVVTEVFKRWKYPEPEGVYEEMPDGAKITRQPSWKDVKGRLWMCSITWNFVVNGGVLVVRYMAAPTVILIAEWSSMQWSARIEMMIALLEAFIYILIWTAVVCGIGLASYDVFVRKMWHRLMLYWFPMKYVQLASGRVVKRPEDQPSDEEAGERTVLPTAKAIEDLRTKPRQPPEPKE